MKNNLFQIIDRNQPSFKYRLKFIDDEANTRSYIPNIIFSLNSIRKISCHMDILSKHMIAYYLEQPDFDPKSENIEVITEDGKPRYVKYNYWLRLDGDVESRQLSKSEYQHLLLRLKYNSVYGDNAKYPTIEELKEYCNSKE